MNFQLDSDQEAFRDAVRGFAERHLRAGALERAHSPEHPWDVAKLMAEQGLLGITIAEKDGGQGGTLMDAVIAIETVAQVCPRSADVVQAGNFGAIRVLAEYGTADQKQRYLARLLSGEGVICVGMTEPEAGSAVTDLKTTATPDGDGFRVTGEKVFTTHAPYADVMVVYVRYGPGVGGIGSVLIPIKAEGVKQGKPSHFLNGEEWVTTWFDNVYVPPENILLREGGFKKQIAGFNVERIGNTARSLALGRYCYETARECSSGSPPARG
jgi:alkylation response protein AidB-like acyl-CoA dehydrogenase